eukprot:scaffold314_cov108-Isochrysis_galbana.AAC.1
MALSSVRVQCRGSISTRNPGHIGAHKAKSMEPRLRSSYALSSRYGANLPAASASALLSSV